MLTHTRYLLCLLLSLLAWLPGNTQAQSACSAVWGIGTISPAANPADGALRYLNTTTKLWSPALLTLNGNANALAGSSFNGLLYYVDRATQQLYSVNPNANPLASTLIGTIPAPPSPALATNMLGGTTNAAGDLFIYVTSGNQVSPTYSYVTVAQVSLATAATVTAWTQILTTAGATPTLNGSGDSFVDAAGTNWILTNTDPPTLHRLDLNIGPSFGRTNVPPLTMTGVNAMRMASVSTDPLTGITYMGGFTGASAIVPYSSVTFQVDLVSGTTTILPQTDTSFLVSDMGNCAIKPAPPTISKS